MIENLIALALLAFVVVAILFAILMWQISRDMRQSNSNLAAKFDLAAEYFLPVRQTICPKCNGVGTVEKENPLMAAIQEALTLKGKKPRGR